MRASFFQLVVLHCSSVSWRFSPEFHEIHAGIFRGAGMGAEKRWFCWKRITEIVGKLRDDAVRQDAEGFLIVHSRGDVFDKIVRN